MCNKDAYRYPWVFEEDACSPRLLFVQKITSKDFVQLKTIDMMGRKNNPFP